MPLQANKTTKTKSWHEETSERREKYKIFLKRKEPPKLLNKQ